MLNNKFENNNKFEKRNDELIFISLDFRFRFRFFQINQRVYDFSKKLNAMFK